MPDRTTAKALARRAAHTPLAERAISIAAGGLRRANAGRGSRLAVLTYHRVDEPAARPDLFPGLISAVPAAFEQQMVRLASRYRIVSLDDMLAFRRGASPPPGTVVAITFDDGYRDVGEIAWPILQRLGIPATLFVPTGLVGGSEGFWWDRLWAALGRVQPGRVVTTPLGDVRIDGEEERAAVHRDWRARLKQVPHERLERLVEETCAALDVPAARGSLLDWSELAVLASQGLALGAHTRGHPLLTSVDAPLRMDELAGARADLDEHGMPTVAMAYPSGAHDAGVVDDAATAGYEIAFTTDRGVEDLRRADWLRLHRINVGSASTVPIIELQLQLPARGRQPRDDGVLPGSDYTTAVPDTAVGGPPRTQDRG